jgi:hypothetical protein
LLHHGLPRLTRVGKQACVFDHLGALVTTQLRKVGPALNSMWILSHESIYRTLQKHDAFSSVDVEAITRQAVITPS